MSLHVLCPQISLAWLLGAFVHLLFTLFYCCFFKYSDSVTFVLICIPTLGPEQLKAYFVCMCKSDVVKQHSVIYLLLRNQSRSLNEDR